jgi:hypothetical protein
MAVSETPTPTGAVDVVGVFTEALTQVFERARPIKAEVMPDSKVMEHPLETGASVVDHRIILPVQINLSMLLTSVDYASVYNQVRDLFNRGELLTVQTRVASYTSMLIEKMPHEESADIADGIALALTLREAFFVTPQFSSIRVASPRDSSTAKRGEQQPKTTPPATQRGSVLSRVFS